MEVTCLECIIFGPLEGEDREVVTVFDGRAICKPHLMLHAESPGPADRAGRSLRSAFRLAKGGR